ncbi:TraX family protein [Intestinimonas butyriciproducens]|uniref:TraX family protein n=1 Tax=Intestinimonas butyriciproducens TaxID=1297617 RepID=UPI00189CAC69|nr:TraX family protein [Intestinimonas butyriciproducens]
MERYKKMDANTIKLIAIIAMTIDHVTWMIYPGYPKEFVPILLHIIGRLTCPIMCYFIAEGYHYTKNLNKYTVRLFLFAFISHFAYVFASMDFVNWKSFIPFYYGSVLNQTSVMWSLAWGLVMLRVVNSRSVQKNTVKVILIVLICLISFPSDWSCVASLCILAFGTNRGKFKTQMLWMVFYVAIYATVYFFTIDKVYGLLQMGIIFAIPIIRLYNGQRGNNEKLNRVMKWLFYLYYPLHLLIIGWIQYAR